MRARPLRCASPQLRCAIARDRSLAGIKDLKDEDKLSAEHAATFARVFREHDKDRSGSIDVGELAVVMKKCGFALNAGALDLIVALSDYDGSGTINEKEFSFFLGRCMKLKSVFKEVAPWRAAPAPTAR